MVMVDTSVWVDFFHQRSTPDVKLFFRLARAGNVTTCDLILHEVLRGFDDEKTRLHVMRVMDPLDCHEVLGKQRALQSATRYRDLRSRGVTVCKPNYAIIASYCIDTRVPLLSSDKDFKGYVPIGLKLLRG